MPALKYEYIPRYTQKDYEEWEGKWELIVGIPYAMSPAPVIKHQIINTKIARELDEAIENCNNGCIAIIEAEWRINKSTILIPDCSLICYEPDDYLNKAPSIIFEVVSKSSVLRDEKIKFEIYAKEGVKYYAIVYPDMLVAKLYRLRDDNSYQKVGDFDTESYIFDIKGCKMKFDFNNIFKRYKAEL